MKSRTAKRYHLREDTRLGKPERVDRERGVLIRCKILGFDSLNNRKYLPEAVRAAARMYTNVGVFTNHPKNPTDSRDVRDRFGWFENVTYTDEGLFGDFHLLDPGDPLSVKLMNAAESNAALYGFSHNVEGAGHVDGDGVFVVESIESVRSVDLVSEPATTSSLFESRKPMKITYRKFFESVVLPKASKAGKQFPQAKRLAAWLEAECDKNMAEGDDKILDEEMADDYQEDAPDTSWKQALQQAVASLTDSDDEASHDMAAKIMKMLRPEKVEPETEAEEPDAAKVEEDEDLAESGSNEIRGKNQDVQKRAMWAKDPEGHESVRRKQSGKELQEQIKAARAETAALKKQLQEEKDAAALSKWLAEECSKRKLALSATMLETVSKSRDRKTMVAALDELKTISTKSTPRSQSPNGSYNVTESVDRKKGFAENARALSAR